MNDFGENKEKGFPLLKVVIAAVRCLKTGKLYGIRFEEKSRNRWIGDWAFPLKENQAGKEGYDKTTIAGSFDFGETYKGCPYCESKGIFKCSCGKINCWDGVVKFVTCRWCGGKGELSGSIESINSGSDR